MQSTRWNELIVEQRTAPPPLTGERFADWMHERRLFISSPMDPEMEPPRAKIAGYLRGLGAIPVMWEEIPPQDRRAETAYLEGVAQSSLFLLVVGSRYGATDQTGYSPTHKEANRAKEVDIPRLLFERGDVPTSARDGRLNDWLRSLHSELSAAEFVSTDDLVAKLDRRLREIAGAQENYWVKLGPLILPGNIHQRSRQGTTEFFLRATLRDPLVRRTVSSWGTSGLRTFSTPRAPQLTWGHVTQSVSIAAVNTQSTSTSSDEVEITCSATGDVLHPGYYGGMTIRTGSREVGPAEQVPLWADLALFGQDAVASERSGSFLHHTINPEGPPLPDVLRRVGAQGWLAEGLVRLYAVEELAAKFSGYFEQLDVGPATGSGVRFHGRCRLPSIGHPVEIRGRVPL